jgi:hypothetical protein
MRPVLFATFAFLIGLQTGSVWALSAPINRDINFPKEYDATKAAAIRSVIQNERFKFVDGIVSYWPPDFGTTLSFAGNAKDVSDFLAALCALHEVSVRLVLFRGRNDELRRDSTWQLYFSQNHPNELAVHVNLNATGLELEKVVWPVWRPGEASR